MRKLKQAHEYYLTDTNYDEFKKLTIGEKLLLSYYTIIQRDDNYVTDKLVIDDICWEDELESLYNALKQFEIDEFILGDTSTALMNALNYFIDKGAKITGNETYRVKELFNSRIEEKGLVIKL